MRIETPDAKTRMRSVERLNELAADREAAVQTSSRLVFWRECERKFGIPAAMLKRISSTDEISKLEKWLAMEDKQQSNRGGKRFWGHFMSKDQGIRLGKDGAKKKTFVSPFEADELQLKSWIRREEEQGHDLEVTDLADEFILILESQVCDMEEKKGALGGLPEADEKNNVVHKTIIQTQITTQQEIFGRTPYVRLQFCGTPPSQCGPLHHCRERLHLQAFVAELGLVNSCPGHRDC